MVYYHKFIHKDDWESTTSPVGKNYLAMKIARQILVLII